MIGNAINGDLRFFHRLQQSRLGFRRGAVNFIGEHNLCYHRTRTKLKVARLLIIDRNTCHIAWQQVGSKLNTFEGTPDRASNRLRENGFTNARHVFDKYVPMTNNGNQAESNRFSLTNNNPLNVPNDTLYRGC